MERQPAMGELGGRGRCKLQCFYLYLLHGLGGQWDPSGAPELGTLHPNGTGGICDPAGTSCPALRSACSPCLWFCLHCISFSLAIEETAPVLTQFLLLQGRNQQHARQVAAHEGFTSLHFRNYTATIKNYSHPFIFKYRFSG